MYQGKRIFRKYLKTPPERRCRRGKQTEYGKIAQEDTPVRFFVAKYASPIDVREPVAK